MKISEQEQKDKFPEGLVCPLSYSLNLKEVVNLGSPGLSSAKQDGFSLLMPQAHHDIQNQNPIAWNIIKQDPNILKDKEFYRLDFFHFAMDVGVAFSH